MRLAGVRAEVNSNRSDVLLDERLQVEFLSRL